eukprot:150430-Hanusia_phi.AAC.1
MSLGLCRGRRAARRHSSHRELSPTGRAGRRELSLPTGRAHCQAATECGRAGPRPGPARVRESHLPAI